MQFFLVSAQSYRFRDGAAGASTVSLPHSIEAPSAQPSLPASSKQLLPWLIAVAFFMESLDTTIL
jgi:hypothetical protein